MLLAARWAYSTTSRAQQCSSHILGSARLDSLGSWREGHLLRVVGLTLDMLAALSPGLCRGAEVRRTSGECQELTQLV
jgi:hypothetical protein